MLPAARRFSSSRGPRPRRWRSSAAWCGFSTATRDGTSPVCVSCSPPLSCFRSRASKVRIVSLLPSATEIVAALGALDQLVGVTHACDYPPQVSRLPRLTSTHVDGAASPEVIDRDVREAAERGDPLYTVDEALLASLRPDVIVTQALCDVCAVRETDVRTIAARLSPAPSIVTLSGTTLDGIFADIERVGAAIDAPDEAEELLLGLRARLRSVHERLRAARAPRPRVAVLEWTDPVYTAGHWVPEMVHRAGGVDALARAGEHSRAVGVA